MLCITLKGGASVLFMADLLPLAIAADPSAVARPEDPVLNNLLKLRKSKFLPFPQSGILQDTVVIAVHLFRRFAPAIFIMGAGTADLIRFSYELKGCRSFFPKEPILHFRHVGGESVTISLPLKEIKAHSVMRTDPVSCCFFHDIRPVL